MELYKAAGAHYFVAQAVHHDNFDNWDSKYQKWNSVNIGPHKDMVGIWQAAAKKLGLPFGVSEHLGHSFTFMQSSHGSDKTGPFAGIPYDGANPAYWDLYQLPAAPDDTGWYSKDPRWAQEWYARIYDLVTTYKPDLLYSDGGLPFGEAGEKIVAELYNLSIQNHDGKQEAVYCCKKHYQKTDFIDGSCVQDLEGSRMVDIQPLPWQTDTSTGEWFWVPNDRYRSSSDVIHSLADIVSKNGNLLLNVTLLPDGSLPPQMETFLREMADWMKVNGDAIFATRPWTISGEGPTKGKPGAFSATTDQDIRFTRKGDHIYAITLGVPTGQLLIRAMAMGSPLVTGDPSSITLLGSEEKIQWSRTDRGIAINLPATLPCKSAVCVKISGLTTVANLTPATLQAFREQLKN
jgi:alpha-L-fucosidase